MYTGTSRATAAIACTGVAIGAAAAGFAPPAAGCVVAGLADPLWSHPAATKPKLIPINAAATHRLVQLIIVFPERWSGEAGPIFVSGSIGLLSELGQILPTVILALSKHSIETTV